MGKSASFSHLEQVQSISICIERFQLIRTVGTNAHEIQSVSSSCGCDQHMRPIKLKLVVCSAVILLDVHRFDFSFNILSGYLWSKSAYDFIRCPHSFNCCIVSNCCKTIVLSSGSQKRKQRRLREHTTTNRFRVVPKLCNEGLLLEKRKTGATTTLMLPSCGLWNRRSISVPPRSAIDTGTWLSYQFPR